MQSELHDDTHAHTKLRFECTGLNTRAIRIKKIVFTPCEPIYLGQQLQHTHASSYTVKLSYHVGITHTQNLVLRCMGFLDDGSRLVATTLFQFPAQARHHPGLMARALKILETVAIVNHPIVPYINDADVYDAALA